MDWSDIGELVGKAAPLIGGALLGPAGAGIGSLVAGALGVENNPESVANAVRNDPDAAIKLQKLQNDHKERLEAMHIEAETARITQINKTMRAELMHDGWFKSGWRPFIGWMVGLSMGGIMAGLVYSMFAFPDMANDTIASATVIISLMLGVLGININKRTQDKHALLGKETGGILAAVASRIKGK